LATKLLQNDAIGIINSEQRSLIEGIENDVDRLLRIVQELLNVSQIESNSVFLTIMPVNLNEIIHYAVQAVRMQAEAKKITISVQSPNDAPVLADSEKTAWVIVNLLSNAIRYSYQETSVVLTIVVREKYIELAVSDAGPGIPPEYVDKIFERYFKIPGSSKQGTGLGLSISKEFIEAQGGSISVESNLGKGSTFTFTLLRQSTTL
jgi:signal transduction histidine kinase